MPNQADIAKALGITQATVSRALRGDRSISAETRQAVQNTADRLRYNPNNYLSTLMSNIRSGKKLRGKGSIGLLIEASSLEDWYAIEAFWTFHQGVLQRARELGVHVDPFFLKQPGISAAKIDEILHARGIEGLILAPPYRGNRTLNMRWERYAAIGVGFGWEEQELNRVAYDNLQCFITAFNELRRMGYQRIGTVLDRIFIDGTRHGINWYIGCLECQDRTPKSDRVPVFKANYPPPGEKISEPEAALLENRFQAWVSKWKPDALLTVVGDERKWLEAMNLRIPQDVGLACLSLPIGSDLAGIEDAGEAVGATAIELVAAQIARNEFGLPSHQKVMMIESRWINGTTVQNKNQGV
jgi:LacI family transcriptional regulator